MGTKPDLDALRARVAAETGIADPSAVRLLRPGAVFEVDDKLVMFPGETARTWHELRRVVVVQTSNLLGPALPDTVLVVPCSASQHNVARWDYLIPPDEPGFTKPHVVAYARLVMPILKAALTAEGHRGQMREESFGALLAVIAKNLGLAPTHTLPPAKL